MTGGEPPATWCWPTIVTSRYVARMHGLFRISIQKGAPVNLANFMMLLLNFNLMFSKKKKPEIPHSFGWLAEPALTAYLNRFIKTAPKEVCKGVRITLLLLIHSIFVKSVKCRSLFYFF